MNINEKFKEVIGSNTQERYQTGYCHVLAIELAKIIPNSRVIAVMDHDLDIESDVLTHALIKSSTFYIDVTGIYSNVNDILDMYEDHGEQYLDSSMSSRVLFSFGGNVTSSVVNDVKEVAKKIAILYREFLSEVINGKTQ